MKKMPCVLNHANEVAIERERQKIINRSAGLLGTRDDAVDYLIQDAFEKFLDAHRWIDSHDVHLSIRNRPGDGAHWVFHGGDYVPSVINAPFTRHHMAVAYLGED